MTAEYFDVGVELDQEDLKAEAVERVRVLRPLFQTDTASPENVLLEVGAGWTSEVAYALTVATRELFKIIGQEIFSVPPLEALPASVLSTWTLADTLGHTITAGTQVLIDDGAGGFKTFEVAADVVVAPGSSATSAGAVSLNAVTPGIEGNGLTGPAQTNDAISWVQSIAIVGSSAGGQDAEDDDTYLARLKRYCELMSPAPILPQDFADLALNIAGVNRSMAYDGYNPEHNLLTANQSSVETNASDYTTSPTNCSVTQSSTVAEDQTYSLRLSSTAGGDMSARTPTGTSGRAVSPSQLYTLSARVRSGASVRNCKVGVRWYDSGGSLIGGAVYGSIVASATGSWTSLSVSAVSPSNAAYAALELFVTATGGAAELHYFDRMQLREGASSSPWVPGGTAATGNLATISVALASADGSAVPSLTATAVKDYLTAMREEGFSVYTLDPVQTTVNVTYQIHLATGADSAATIAAVDAALAEYLSAANWGKTSAYSNPTSESWVLASKVRLYEIVTLINKVGGVDYVGTVQINGSAADLTISGPAPLTTPGTMTGTVI